MAKWRDVPAEFEWSETGLRPVRAKPGRKPSAKVNVTKPSTAGVAVATAPATTQAVVLTPAVVQAAAQETEQALDKILGLIPPASSVVEVPLSPVESSNKEDLWGPATQTLDPEDAAIYPEGRPVNNPNHLMLMVWNGAEVRRVYTTSGWISKVHRLDGKENPATDKMVEVLIKAGHLVECRKGVYRGARS